MPNPIYDAIPDFGVLYDAVPAYGARGDARFYAEEAARTDGDILEIGCGTGRVLLPVAWAGKSVTGLDPSGEMLDRLREKLDLEAPDVRARVTLVEGDARDFDLGRSFALITAPFRVMQHLRTIDDQLAMLRCVAKHLAPGGRFIFDVFNPKWPLLLTDRSAETEDTPEFALPDGRRLRRTSRIVQANMIDQVNEVELIYYVTPPGGGRPERYVQAFGMRWFMPAEVRHLLARAGLREEAVFGNFERSPLEEGSPEQVWILRKEDD